MITLTIMLLIITLSCIIYAGIHGDEQTNDKTKWKGGWNQ